MAVTLKSLGLEYVQASDISDEALKACSRNAKRNEMHLDRVVMASLLEDGKADLYDLICFNPPCGTTSSADKEKSTKPEAAVDGGVDGMTLTLALLDQARARLSRQGSLVFIAVSTGALARLIAALDRIFPQSWRVLPASPVAAPWVKETDERALALRADARDFTPVVWPRGDGWLWRFSWVIEASMLPNAFPSARGLSVSPYGYDTKNDPVLTRRIERFSVDGYWLNADCAWQ